MHINLSIREGLETILTLPYCYPTGTSSPGTPSSRSTLGADDCGILQSEFNFKTTTHEQNLYSAEIKGEIVYVCWQVDDFTIASNTIAVADYINSIIDKHVSTSNKGLGTKYKWS